jgi:thiamine kinase-like enzyme
MVENTSHTRTIELDEDSLAVTVAEMLSAAEGRAVQVREIRRQPSPFATLFPAEVLSVSPGDGTEVRLFLKHLGSEQPDQPDKQRRDREIRVYETLLRDDGLPVPKYYGSRWNSTTDRYELYLEYVDAWPLKYHHLEHWVTAAKRLADFHAHFAVHVESLEACDFLLRLNETYFAAWAQRAIVALASQSTELAKRLAEILSNYSPIIKLLAGQPPTLVHNDLAPKNVIADPTQTPARICLIDWEMAGIGCGLLDLVHLKYGLSPDQEQEMLTAYRSRMTHLLPKDDQQFAQLLAACELHKTLYRLAHSPAWNLPLTTLAQWVGEAQEFRRQFTGGRA